MRMKILCVFLFFCVCPLLAQESISIRLDGKQRELSAVNKNGVEFVSVRQLSRELSASVFFNPSNQKMEMKFQEYYLKITAQNKFIILTSRSNNQQEVFQIPLAPMLEGEDMLVPVEFCLPVFSSAIQKKLVFNATKGEISAEGLNETPDAALQQQTHAGPAKESSVTDDKATLKRNEEEKKTSTEKVQEPEKTVSRYDIQGVIIDAKSNGTLIRIKSSKKITGYSSTISNGTLFLNILGLSADEKKIESTEAKGLIRKIEVKRIKANTQIAFILKEGYSSSETLQDASNNDLMITIHNKLFSNHSPASSKLKERWSLNTVVIDAGHGGKDPGARGINGVSEKDINLAIALKLGAMIEENMKDVKVVYTRSNDKFVELYKRGKIANEKNGNLFISIHCNSTPSKPTNANGFEIYLLRPGRTREAISIAERENSVIQYEDNPSHYQKLTDENFILVSMAHSSYMRYSEQFSGILSKQFGQDLSISSNGIKQAGFYVLVGASMPSVLVETGFLSNRKDAEYISSKNGQSNIAASIFKAVKTFKSEYDKVIQAGL
ncbi:MAG: N-acetylmuramoyl-L-alanine amidase [Ignavibacteriales bacterium]